MATRGYTTPASDLLTPRMLFLAGLGLAAVTRREARNAATSAFASAAALGGRAAGLATDARNLARGSVLTLRERIEPVAYELGAGVEARLAPVLARFGLATPAGPAPRKAGAKKAAKASKGTTRRQPSRKAAPRKAASKARSAR